MSVPLGSLVAITGASGSGKSTLINDMLYKALWKKLEDTRTLPGEHDGIDGLEHVHKVVSIDQSPDRPQQPVEPGDLCRLLRHHPRSVHERAAIGRARVQAGPLQFQRQGRALRGVPGRRRHHDAAVLHARRRGDLRQRAKARVSTARRSKSPSAARRSTMSSTCRSRRASAFFTSEPAIAREDRGAQRSRPRLPDARPVGDDALGR